MTIDPSVEPGQAKAIQEDYMAILDSILKRIKSLAGKKDPRITIKFGNESASYKKDPEKGVERNAMDAEKVAQLKQALEDPKSLGKSLQIFVDGKIVDHADREGNVSVDTIGLRSLLKVQQQLNQSSQARKVPQVTIPQSQKVKDVQHVQKPPPPLTLEGLQQQISDLQQIVNKQQQTIDALSQAVEKISTSIVPSRTSDPALSHWLSFAKQTLQTAGQSLVGKLNQMGQGIQLQANSKVQAVQSQVTDKVQQVKLNVTHKVQDIHNNVVHSIHQTIAGAKGQMIESATKLMLEHIGDRYADGSKTYESKNYLFSEKNGQISIASKDGRGEVMKDGQLTVAASSDDVQRLDNMAQSVYQDFGQTQSQNQQATETQTPMGAAVRRR